MRRAVVSLLVLASSSGAQLGAVDGGAASADGHVILTERVSGIATLRTWLLASPLAQQWQGKEAEPIRRQVDDALAQVQRDQGIDVRALLGDLDEVRVQFLAAEDPPMVKNEPFAIRLGVSLPHAADDLWRALGTLAKSDGAELLFPNDGRISRSGTWITFAHGCPSSAIADVAPAAAQVAGSFDLDALWSAAKLGDGAAVAHAFALGKGTFSSTFADDGSRDRALLLGARLPLAPIDPAALSFLPADAMTVGALGLDGERLVAAFDAMGKDSPVVGDAIGRAEKTFGALGLGELRPLLRSLSGTAAAAITSGVPFPGITVMVPASPALDQLLDQLATRVGVSLAKARDEAVLVPLPPQVPLMLQLRRTATHWIASTDAMLLDRLAHDLPTDGFDALAKCKQLGDGAGGARLLWCQDNQAQARMMQGYLAAGASQAGGRQPKEQVDGMRVAAKLLADLGPRLKPTVVAILEGADCTRVEARNATMQVSSGAVLAGMMLPAINMVRESARRSSSGNNERQLILACLVYANENDNKWPATLESMKEEMGAEMPDKLFISPSAPEIVGAYLYVRPNPEAGSMQPVIVEDPACNRGRGSMVGYGDGHISYLKGAAATALWNEARRLSELPKAKDAGIAADDWTAAEDAPPQPAQAVP